MNDWTIADIPDQANKVILITGATSGLGLAVATTLAQKRASVILASRDQEKGELAVAKVKNALRGSLHGELSFLPLDLADLDSVKTFCEHIQANYSRLDCLINNAGIMMPNQRMESRQGFEVQFATNHLGHFLLTSHLLPVLEAAARSRVVTVGSNASNMKFADIYYDDLQFKKRYKKMPAYAQSKMANIMFALALRDKLHEHNSHVISVAAHPGYTATKLQRHMGVLGNIMNMLLAQGLDMGVLPILRAATDPNVIGGEYFGPNKFNEFRGYPVEVPPPPLARDQLQRQKLWTLTEQLIGEKFNPQFW